MVKKKKNKGYGVDKAHTESLTQKIMTAMIRGAQMVIAGILYGFTIYLLTLLGVSFIDQMLALTMQSTESMNIDPVSFLVILTSSTTIIIAAVVLKVKYYTWVKQLSDKIGKRKDGGKS